MNISTLDLNCHDVNTINAALLGYESVLDRDYLIIPGLEGFKQTGAPTYTSDSPREHNVESHQPQPCILINGVVRSNLGSDDEMICPHCGCRMHLNAHLSCKIRHVPIGFNPTVLDVGTKQYLCPNCKKVYREQVPFKACGHMITEHLQTFVEGLLESKLTLKEVAKITGLSQPVVKDIDKNRLNRKYTVNGEGKEFIKPKITSTKLGIDEFLLHSGHKYATVIIDLDTGHVLWLYHGKSKEAVYKFIEHVGMDWMKNVQCVVSDMNADFQSAFKEKCPWLKEVYDRFHLVKNFNDKVISEVRKDEQKRLIQEGRLEDAARLKGSKYILTTSAETRRQNDNKEEMKDGALRKRKRSNDKEETIFDAPPKKKTYQDLEATYQDIIKDNKLLLGLDFVKNAITDAYNTAYSYEVMNEQIISIIDYCRGIDNKHFNWFANLLENHIDGICNYALFHITSGKVEGTNNMIKTLRRRHFGIPDDDYLFLKIMDESRR